MTRILHIINGLGSGGAESMLYKLLKYSDKEKYQHEVLSMLDEGDFGNRIRELGVKVHCLNLGSKNILTSIINTRKIAKSFDIIDTWLYHADLLGFLIAKISLRRKLIWNVRHSGLEKGTNKPRTLRIVKLNSLLSRHVDLITFNSNQALQNHLEAGYSNKNHIVIPNGFELDKFEFSLDNRLRVRQELGLNEEKAIITVGRWNIQKDYYTLFKSLYELKTQNIEFKMIMVGAELNYSNIELVELMNKYDLNNSVMLLDKRTDIPALLSAADIYISSSLGESFSNSIGEAMACELPCVVTDVGESKLMVGSTGRIVGAKDYMDMSKQLSYYLKKSDLNRNLAARERVIDNYDIWNVVRVFEKNYVFVK